MDALIAPEAVRRDFFGHERLVCTLYRAVKPDPAALVVAQRVAGIATVAATIRESGPPAIDLSKIDFEALSKRFDESTHKNTDIEVLKLSKSLDDEQQRHVRENLTEEELTIFDILTRPAPERTTDERDEVKKVAKGLLARLRELLVLNWRQKAAARSQLKLAIEDALDAGLPRAYTPELYRAKCSAVFEHVYEGYPERGEGIYADVA